MRIVGTIIGAVIALACASTLAYNHALCALFLLAAGTLGTLGYLLSPYGYAWLLAAVTAMMVVLMSLTDPTVAFSGATDRVVDVMIGTAAVCWQRCCSRLTTQQCCRRSPASQTCPGPIDRLCCTLCAAASP